MQHEVGKRCIRRVHPLSERRASLGSVKTAKLSKYPIHGRLFFEGGLYQQCPNGLRSFDARVNTKFRTFDLSLNRLWILYA